LVSLVQRDLFNRRLPNGVHIVDEAERSTVLSTHAEHQNWRAVEVPCDGAIGLMSRGARLHIHSGVFLSLDGGGCLHTDDPHGVVFDSLLDLAARGWRADWYAPRA
jgi:hypothetical protein